VALGFLKFLNGINYIPKPTATGSEAGDLESVEVGGGISRLQYFDGVNPSSPVITDVSTDVLTNKTLVAPHIVLDNNPIVFFDTITTHTISLEGPPAGDLPNNYVFALPSTPGTIDQVLTTDGDGNTSWTTPVVDALPTGIIMAFAGSGSAVPAGWLICGGQAVSRTVYANLFALCGTTYGVGDGSTTFNVPDLRGTVPAGVDNMGGTPANRLTVGGSGISGVTLGASGGTETHALDIAELAAHTHTAGTLTNSTSSVSGTITNATSAVTGTISATGSNVTGTIGGSDGTHNHAVTDPGHVHTYEGAANSGAGLVDEPMMIAPTGSSSAGTTNTATTGITVSSNDGGHGHGFSLTATAQNITSSLTAAAQIISYALTAAAQTISGLTGSTGSGTAHQNTQPTLILNYIIKT
jgi:microcystin-dependent protein